MSETASVNPDRRCCRSWWEAAAAAEAGGPVQLLPAYVQRHPDSVLKVPKSTSVCCLSRRAFHEELPRLLKPEGLYSFFNGLAADNGFFHAVCCRVVAAELSRHIVLVSLCENSLDVGICKSPSPCHSAPRRRCRQPLSVRCLLLRLFDFEDFPTLVRHMFYVLCNTLPHRRPRAVSVLWCFVSPGVR